MAGKGGGGRLGGGKAPFWKRAQILGSGGRCGGQVAARRVSGPKHKALVRWTRLTRWKRRLRAVVRIRSEVDAWQLLERRSAALLFGLRALGGLQLRRGKAVWKAVERLGVVAGHVGA